MIKKNVIIGSLVLILFTGAQVRGWNLFETGPGPKPSPGSSRTYHK